MYHNLGNMYHNLIKGEVRKMLPVEQKTEILFKGLSIGVPTGATGINLIEALALESPEYGQFYPFLNTESGKLNVFNTTEQVTLKVNIVGAFRGDSSNRSLTMRLLGTDGNALTQNRPAASELDIFSFVLPVMVDKDGNVASNGTAIQLFAGGGAFSVAECLIAVTQRVTPNTELAIV